MYNECGSPSSPSLKNKIKSSICCFCTPSDQLEALEYQEYGGYTKQPRSPRSPYAWLKSQSQELLEIKDRRRNLFARISNKSRKRQNSADFSYDPLSYALNFEDDRIRDDEPFVSFSSRLPISPDRSEEAPIVTAMSREIVACS